MKGGGSSPNEKPKSELPSSETSPDSRYKSEEQEQNNPQTEPSTALLESTTSLEDECKKSPDGQYKSDEQESSLDPDHAQPNMSPDRPDKVEEEDKNSPEHTPYGSVEPDQCKASRDSPNNSGEEQASPEQNPTISSAEPQTKLLDESSDSQCKVDDEKAFNPDPTPSSSSAQHNTSLADESEKSSDSQCKADKTEASSPDPKPSCSSALHTNDRLVDESEKASDTQCKVGDEEASSPDIKPSCSSAEPGTTCGLTDDVTMSPDISCKSDEQEKSPETNLPGEPNAGLVDEPKMSPNSPYKGDVSGESDDDPHGLPAVPVKKTAKRKREEDITIQFPAEKRKLQYCIYAKINREDENTMTWSNSSEDSESLDDLTKKYYERYQPLKKRKMRHGSQRSISGITEYNGDKGTADCRLAGDETEQETYDDTSEAGSHVGNTRSPEQEAEQDCLNVDIRSEEAGEQVASLEESAALAAQASGAITEEDKSRSEHPPVGASDLDAPAPNSILRASDIQADPEQEESVPILSATAEIQAVSEQLESTAAVAEIQGDSHQVQITHSETDSQGVPEHLECNTRDAEVLGEIVPTPEDKQEAGDASNISPNV